MAHIPAAIRYKNPGAMWPGKIATKWGSTHWDYLNDGTGQGGGGHGNKIAYFPTFVQGAAAQFDLWATNYTTGETLKQLIARWSGGNSPAGYVKFLEDSTGISVDTRVTRALLASPAGWKLLKAQSHWEAGQEIPMTDGEWQEAQRMAFKGAALPKKAGAVASGAGSAAVAHQAGLPIWAVVLIGVAVAAVVWFIWEKRHD